MEKAFQPTRKTALQAKNWSAETMKHHDLLVLLVFSSLAGTSVADGHSLSPAATAGKKTCIFFYDASGKKVSLAWNHIVLV